MNLSIDTLRLVQNVLLAQPMNIGAPDEQIQAVLTAKRELAEAIAELSHQD